MKWDIDKVHGAMWIAGEAAKSLLGSMKEKTGICFTEHICYVHNFNFEWCTLEEENKKIGMFLVERFKNKGFSDNFVKEYKKFDKNTIKELDNIDKKEVSKISDKELFELLKKTTKFYIKNFYWGFIIEPMDFVMPGLIETMLIKKGVSPSEIADIMAVADITFLNKETQCLIKIATRPENKQKELLEKHAYKYRWLQSGHMGRKDLPYSYFEERLNEIKKKDLGKELAHLKNFKREIMNRKQEILKKKGVDAETKVLIRIADTIAPLHDRRKELFLRSIYAVDTIRGEIAKRYGYTKQELSVFQIENILKLQNKEKLDKKYANEMIKHGLLYVNTKKNIWKYYAGKEAKEFAERELTINLGDIKEIKGMIASTGKARGKVKIIHGVRDIDKMKQGDILVTGMTRPEFILAMRKASAIVTDEGGVTCHAAIVSRELRIPCIIGTKIASSVLKDNDLVEVDADNGVVKILK